MKKKPRFWTFRAAAGGDGKVGELLLYGPISDTSWLGDEVTPKQFHEDLKALGDIQTLNIFINSGGGDVFAAQAIYSMLARHSATKNVYIDGLAASGASLIAMVGDKVTMPKNAMMMIHGPWTVAWGFAADFRKAADELDKIREAMIPVYTGKSGLSREELMAIMDAETWFTAEEAVEKGFADEVEETKEVAASLIGRVLSMNGQEFDLSRFRTVPKVTDRPLATDGQESRLTGAAPLTSGQIPPEPRQEPGPGGAGGEDPQEQIFIIRRRLDLAEKSV